MTSSLAAGPMTGDECLVDWFQGELEESIYRLLADGPLRNNRAGQLVVIEAVKIAVNKTLAAVLKLRSGPA